MIEDSSIAKEGNIIHNQIIKKKFFFFWVEIKYNNN